MNARYIFLIAVSTISLQSNTMERDLEPNPTLVSSKEVIYFKRPEDVYTVNIHSLNLSDEEKAKLEAIQLLYNTNVAKIEEHMIAHAKKSSKSRNYFDRFFGANIDTCEIKLEPLFSLNDDEQYCRIYSYTWLPQCCKPDLEEFFYDKEYVEKLLSEIPGITIASEIDIEETLKEHSKIKKKETAQRTKKFLKNLKENNN